MHGLAHLFCQIQATSKQLLFFAAKKLLRLELVLARSGAFEKPEMQHGDILFLRVRS